MVALAVFLVLAGRQYGPSQTVQALYDSIARLDSSAAMACILGGDENREIWPRMELKNPWSFVISELAESISGDRARVHATVINQTSSPIHPEVDHDLVSLLKVNGEWKIVPYRQTKRTHQHITNAMALGFLQENHIMFVRETPALPDEEQAALDTVDRTTRACADYSWAHNDLLPPVSDPLSDVRPYMKPLRDFLGRDLYRAKAKLRHIVSFNTNLCGLDIVYLGDPSKTVLTYEGKGEVLGFDKAGKAAVGFVDGGVKMVSRTETAGLRWKPISVP